MLKFKRVNMGSKDYPLYVYDSEIKVDEYTSKYRIVKSKNGWEVRFSTECRKDFSQQFENFWGFKTKKDAIETLDAWVNREF